MKRKINKLISFIIIICMISALSFTVIAADDDPLPAPDWVQVTTNPGGSKTVTVTTPSYMTDVVNYYEYSTDSGLTWSTLNDPAGGEFVFESITEFSLRYVYSGFRSTVYTVTVTITKNTAITSDSGITLIIPNDSDIPADVKLSSYEIVSGTSYNDAYSYFGENKPFTLFDIHIMLNNKVYKTETVKNWMLPKGEFDIRYCKVYYISDDGEFTLLESTAEFNVLLVNTDKTGLFAIVEDRSYCKGDVNGDAVITAADARLALRNSAQLEFISEEGLNAADYNEDGTITAADARLILRVSANLES